MNHDEPPIRLPLRDRSKDLHLLAAGDFLRHAMADPARGAEAVGLLDQIARGGDEVAEVQPASRELAAAGCRVLLAGRTRVVELRADPTTPSSPPLILAVDELAVGAMARLERAAHARLGALRQGIPPLIPFPLYAPPAWDEIAPHVVDQRVAGHLLSLRWLALHAPLPTGAALSRETIAGQGLAYDVWWIAVAGHLVVLDVAPSAPDADHSEWQERVWAHWGWLKRFDALFGEPGRPARREE
jgi:hypothetical protein